MLRHPFLLTSFALVFAAGTALAAFPRLISYQGQLLESGGSAPVPNGNYALTFRLYAQRTGGAAIFTEARASVPVSGGVFSVDLGEISALPAAAFVDSCFLGTQVGTDPELAPRVLLTMAPFAARAAAVEDGSIVPSSIAAGTVVRSVNGLKDDVTLAAGSNVTITPSGQTLTIDATGGGLVLPFAGSASSNSSPAFSVANSGGHSAAEFLLTGIAGSGRPALRAHHNNSNGIAVQADGTIRAGTTGFPGRVQVQQNTNFDDVDAELSSTASGGRLDLKHRLSTAQLTAETRLNEELHLFSHNGGGTFTNGVEITANLSNAARDRLQLVEGAQVIRLLAGTPNADSTVQLPAGAIDAAEMADEPGVASATSGATATTLTGGVDALLSRTITAPAAGFALVIGTTQVQPSHTNGTSSDVNVGVSDDPAAFPANQDVGLQVPALAASGVYSIPITVHGLFQVTAGIHTFYLLAQRTSGASCTTIDEQLSVLFVPTAYGTVSPTLLSPAGDEAATAPRAPLGAAELSAERAEHQRWLDDGARRELDELRARVIALERERADERAARGTAR